MMSLKMPYRQISVISIVFILVIALVTICIGWLEKFRDDRYNRLAVYFGVFTLLVGLGSILRNIVNMEQNVDIITVPYPIKCLFGEPRCETGNFSLWTIFHIVVFSMAGYYLPGLYVEILVLSLFFELLENHVGYQSKFIIDIGINIASYTLGSYLSPFH
jgi:hypothetical protein